MNQLQTGIYAVAGTLLLSLGSPLQAAFSYQVSGVQTEIYGTTTDVPGSGSAANYDSNTVVGDFAVFDMVAVGGGGGPTDFADLRVTYTADNGGIGSDIMIARTSNSQGLTDTGTISILMDIGNGGGGTATLTFDWFTPGSFVGGVEQSGSSLLSTRINYTSFDIDFNQLVSVQRSEVESYTLDGNTQLTATDNGTTITFEDSGASSTFNDPETAAQFLTRSSIVASHSFGVGKQSDGGPALFMLEFRDPSDVIIFNDPDTTPVPEPSSFALLVGGVAMLQLLRRRRR